MTYSQAFQWYNFFDISCGTSSCRKSVASFPGWPASWLRTVPFVYKAISHRFSSSFGQFSCEFYPKLSEIKPQYLWVLPPEGYGLWSTFPCEPTRWTQKRMEFKGVWGMWAMGYEGVDCIYLALRSWWTYFESWTEEAHGRVRAPQRNGSGCTKLLARSGTWTCICSTLLPVVHVQSHRQDACVEGSIKQGVKEINVKGKSRRTSPWEGERDEQKKEK